VVGRWAAADVGSDWEATLGLLRAEGDDLGDAIRRLGLVNAHQWRLEDECRERYADDVALAELKRRIDASNARRVTTVDEIDRIIGERITPAVVDASSPPALATPGDVIDRLSVLVLKHHHAAAAPSERSRQVLAVVAERLADLSTALDRLLGDIAAGRIRCSTVPTPKMYGSG
jgi:hypothetical protein